MSIVQDTERAAAVVNASAAVEVVEDLLEPHEPLHRAHLEEPPEALVHEEIRVTGAATHEDRNTLVGAALGSLATTWVLFEQVLPFEGRTGFILSWYAVFMVFYAVLTARTRPPAVVVDRLVTTVVVAAPTLIAAALVTMVLTTLGEAMPALVHLNFYIHDMAGVRPTAPLSDGGIAHAIVGTLIEVGIGVAISLPLGVLTAVFMSEVGGPGSRLVRTVVEAMTALPSIVAGLFVYTVFIVHFHMQSSGLAASIALSIMGLPIMARASDVVLRIVPGGLREASYALGASRWQTVWRVVLPTARPGLATALILGIARMVGETSPLLLTSGASSFFNADPLHRPMNSLPLYIYSAITSGVPLYVTRGYGAAVVLLTLVLVLFLLARFFARTKVSR